MALAAVAKHSSSTQNAILTNEDAWVRIKDPIERKKRQNRLRQRAWRERRKEEEEAKKLIQAGSDNNNAWKGYGMLVISNHLQNSDKNNFAKVTAINSLGNISKDLQYSQSNTCEIISPLAEHAKTSIPLSSTATTRQQIIPPLLPYNTPTTNPFIPKPYPLIFPLSADHRLITLVQYNVIRAVIFNMNILSIQDHLPEGCMESLGVVPLNNNTPLYIIPPDLQPTPLQNQVQKDSNVNKHQTQTNNNPQLPYWIHALPFPKFRDNLILLYSGSEACDFQDLAQDLGEGLYKGFDDAERRGFLVWGNPWSGQDWEVSDGFVKKWGFLLKGCWDIIDATNRWRELRGEKRLGMEV